MPLKGFLTNRNPIFGTALIKFSGIKDGPEQLSHKAWMEENQEKVAVESAEANKNGPTGILHQNREHLKAGVGMEISDDLTMRGPTTDGA